MADKSKEVADLFMKMDFQDLPVSTNLVKAWLSKHSKLFKSEADANANVMVSSVVNDIKVFYKDGINCGKNFDTNEKLDVVVQPFLYEELIAVIEKNEDFLIELELCFRGFLPRDTKKSIELFKQYFKTYKFDKTDYEPVPGYVYDTMPLSLIGKLLSESLSFENVSIRADSKTFLLLYAIQDLSKDFFVQSSTNFKLSHLQDADLSSELHFYRNTKCPFLIFEGSDVDSAIETTIDAAWSAQGLLPWSTDTIYVQESIAESFINKLKDRLNSIPFGPANNAVHSYTFPYLLENYNEKFAKIVKDASEKGIEMYQPNKLAPTENFIPTLFIGGYIYDNNVLPNDGNTDLLVPHLKVITFRTTAEGINLVNTSPKESFAVSVWLESGALENDVITKLKTKIIWVNCYQVFNGEEISRRPKSTNSNKTGLESIALKWRSKAPHEKIFTLRSVAFKLVQEKFTNEKLWSEPLIEVPFNLVQKSVPHGLFGKYFLKRIAEPRGIVRFKKSCQSIDRIVVALLAGNIVLVDRLMCDPVDHTVIKYLAEHSLPIKVDDVLEGSSEICKCDDSYSIDDFTVYKYVWSIVGEKF